LAGGGQRRAGWFIGLRSYSRHRCRRPASLAFAKQNTGRLGPADSHHVCPTLVPLHAGEHRGTGGAHDALPKLDQCPRHFLPTHGNGRRLAAHRLVADRRSDSGVTVRADKEGTEASRFQGTTSGHVIPYDVHGKLLFSGGISSSRGHFRDNAGRSGVTQLLRVPIPPQPGKLAPYLSPS
jgi:hypothetical protein